jgi:hypothetical protein
MEIRFGHKKEHKYILAGVIAAIMVIILSPLQHSTAFVANINLPSSITQDVAGTSFTIQVQVAANELISIQKIEIIGKFIPTGETGHLFFDQNGNFIASESTPGTAGIVKNNKLTITPSPNAVNYGYAYGYGLVSYGYGFPSNYNFLGGNPYGYSFPGITYFVTQGYVGPITINITGTLNTAVLPPGTYEFSALIHTGAGGNGQDKIVAPPVTFTLNQPPSSSPVSSTTISTGSDISATIATPQGNITITFNNVTSAGPIAVQIKDISSITNLPNTNPNGTFVVGGSTVTPIGPVFWIDLSGISVTGSITVTLPLPPDAAGTLSLFRHNGAAWEQATNVIVIGNTITGTFAGLSPVVIGQIAPPAPPAAVIGGGGGGAVIIQPTLPKVTIQPSLTLNVKDTQVGKDITIAGTITDDKGNKLSIDGIVYITFIGKTGLSKTYTAEVKNGEYTLTVSAADVLRAVKSREVSISVTFNGFEIQQVNRIVEYKGADIKDDVKISADTVTEKVKAFKRSTNVVLENLTDHNIAKITLHAEDKDGKGKIIAVQGKDFDRKRISMHEVELNIKKGKSISFADIAKIAIVKEGKVTYKVYDDKGRLIKEGALQ